MRTLIRIAKSLLKRAGIVVFKRSSGLYVPDEDSYRIAAALCGRLDPAIIDGGAHRGDAAEAFFSMLPNAEIHCFEPDPDLSEELRRTFAGRPNIRVAQVALGESVGREHFNINVSRPTSSLLPSAIPPESELGALSRTVRQIEVDVLTIDAYCTERSLKRVDIIKLDLQGYDYKALCGARSILPEVSVVLVEVLFTLLYKGGARFSDILRLMEETGFELYTLSGLHYDSCNRLLWSDAIFTNTRLRGRGLANA